MLFGTRGGSGGDIPVLREGVRLISTSVLMGMLAEVLDSAILCFSYEGPRVAGR